MFDYLYQRKTEIERRFEGPLEWLRLNDNKVSAILCRKSFDEYNRDSWTAMIDWLVKHVAKMEQTFRPEIDGLRQFLRNDASDLDEAALNED